MITGYIIACIILAFILGLIVIRHCNTETSILRQVQHQMDTFVRRLVHKYPNDPDVNRLRERYKQTKLFLSDSIETYTVNKGEKIVMCIHNHRNDRKTLHEDINLLTFVALHELAHVVCITVDHTDEFWDTFRFLLTEAVGFKMYSPVDYNRNPVEYCAMIVSDNPFFGERSVDEINKHLTRIMENI